MQRARHKTLFQHEHGFEQAGHAGARFQMADIGLCGTDRQRCRAVLRNGVPDRPGLRRIAGLGAGAMRFKGQETIRIHSAFFNQAFQQSGLRIAIGQRNTNGTPRRIACGAKQQRADWLMRGLGIGKAAQDDNPSSFGPDIAIRRRVKHLAAPMAGKHTCVGKADEGIRREQQIDPAHHGRFQGRVFGQGACREMQCNE